MKVSKTLKNITFKEYCDIKKYEYSIIKKSYFQGVYLPIYIDNLNKNAYMEVNYPEIYVAKLYNVNLIGKQSLVFDDDDYCIYDMPCRDIENKFNLKCANTVYIDKEKTSIVYDDMTIDLIDEGIMLIANASANYYHINFEVFSKLCLIEELGLYPNMPIIVDEVILSVSQFKEELDKLNKSNRKVIYLKKGICYKVKKMIYISELAIIPLNRRIGKTCEYGELAISELAIKLLNKNLAVENVVSRKIFISRKYSKNKRLENYEAIEEMFLEFGYEPIYPDQISFDEQVKIFSQAKYIAGVSGAGLTNILFANKCAKIICIMPKDVKTACYSTIAGILGQEYYFIDAKLSAKKDQYAYYQSAFEVDEKSVYEFLKNIHSK